MPADSGWVEGSAWATSALIGGGLGLGEDLGADVGLTMAEEYCGVPNISRLIIAAPAFVGVAGFRDNP